MSFVSGGGPRPNVGELHITDSASLLDQLQELLERSDGNATVEVRITAKRPGTTIVAHGTNGIPWGEIRGPEDGDEPNSGPPRPATNRRQRRRGRHAGG